MISDWYISTVSGRYANLNGVFSGRGTPRETSPARVFLTEYAFHVNIPTAKNEEIIPADDEERERRGTFRTYPSYYSISTEG